MKKIFFILPIFFFILSCHHSTSNTQILQAKIDSLNKITSNTYKPGFGEIMSSIQRHHSKLWFAGQNQNWKLADFEVHEIMEALDDIKEFQKERKESRMIDMANPALTAISSAIQQKSFAKFRESFSFLTTTCNNCHKAVNFEFIKIKIPESSPFANQDFKGN
jgi:hypothetical protein